MAITKFLARDLVIEIQTNPVGPVFTPIGGLGTLTHNPSTNRADAADFDSNGRAEHIVVERGDSWALAGHAKEDVATGDKDLGQEKVEALAQEVGLDSLGTFRITSPGGNVIQFEGSAEVTLPGGGHNDLATWAATITVSGAVQYTPALT